MDIILKQDRSTITDAQKVLRFTPSEIRRIHKGETEKPKIEPKKLKRKLREIAVQNETLAKALTDKNQEINDLKRSVQSLNDVLNSVPIDELRCNSSIASMKILELSKKNRTLRAELETTKLRASKKDAQILRLERELKNNEDRLSQDTELIRKASGSPLDEMQTKIRTLQQKLFENRNKNVELTNQLKLAQKCLQQEVGENFNLNILATHSAQSNWRGRAQQILHLQQRIHELKERLEVYEAHGTARISSFPACSSEALTTSAEGNAKSASGGGTSLSQDRFQPSVRRTELQHRAKVDGLEKDIVSLKVQLEEHRAKILALKVRNKTLNDEVSKFRMKSSTLEEQTGYNGLNLATMNEKINVQKYQYETRLEELSREIADLKRERDDALFKEEELRIRVDNLGEKLLEKGAYIDELQGTIKKLEDDLRATCGDFLFSCRELRKEEFISILDALEAEKNQLHEHTQTLNERLQKERTKNEGLMEAAAKQKVRILRLEAKMREMEKELDTLTERKKRSQRIADYANSISATSLSGSLGSFTFENSSMTSLGVVSDQVAVEDNAKPPKVLELKNQLELAKERIILLEEKVAYMAEEKENDSRTFDEIIGNSKAIILDTIMNFKGNGPDSSIGD